MWMTLEKEVEGHTNLLLFKICSEELGEINLLHIHLEWFICSSTQAFL